MKLVDLNATATNKLVKVNKLYYNAAEKVWRKVGPMKPGAQAPEDLEFDGVTKAPTGETWEYMKKNFIKETATDWMNKVQEFKIISQKFRESAEAIYNQIVRAHNVLTAMQVNTLPTELKAMETPKSQYHEKAHYAMVNRELLGKDSLDKQHEALQTLAEGIASHAYRHENPGLLKEFGQKDWTWTTGVGDCIEQACDGKTCSWGETGQPTAGKPVMSYEVSLMKENGVSMSVLQGCMEAAHHHDGPYSDEYDSQSHEERVRGVKQEHRTAHLEDVSRRN
jgi:hypothetical protein